MPEGQTANSTVLNSWKEIASYVGRGVRTVQRWEADLGMPVRRPRAKSRSAVIAMSDEIDRWLRSAPTAEVGHVAHADTKACISGVRQAMAEHMDLRTRCTELRDGHHDAMTRLMSSIQSLQRALEPGRRVQQTSQEQARTTAA